jgi:hypothetical protein
MLKQNMDTMAAVSVLGQATNRRPKVFGFAGTKDKRGITTQVPRRSPLCCLRIAHTPNDTLVVCVHSG